MVFEHTPAQAVTFWSCSGISWMTCGFSVPQIRQCCLLTPPQRVKWASSVIKILSQKSGSASIVLATTFPYCKRRYLSVGNNLWVSWTLYGNRWRSCFIILLRVVPLTFNSWDLRWYDTFGLSATLSLTASTTSSERLGRDRMGRWRVATDSYSKIFFTKLRIVLSEGAEFLPYFLR